MSRFTLQPGRPADDPGEAWADDLLAPLRRQRHEVDVVRSVMSRVEARRPLPSFSPLPGRWPEVAWAASLLLGVVCLGILLATAGIMVAQGDEGYRTLVTLATSMGRVALHAVSSAGGVLAALWVAVLAFCRATWTVVEAMAPLVRGAGSLAAVAGLLSLAFSAFVFAHSRRTAPVAASHPLHPMNGGM